MSRNKLADLRAELGDEVRAYQTMVDAFDEAAAAYLGVNRTDLRCLDVLLRLESAAPGGLAAALGLTTGSVTAMLDRLERLGYLTRAPDPADRRKVIVRPTPLAASLADEIYGPLVTEASRWIASYTAAELELLIGFMRRGQRVQERHLRRVRALPPAR
jgi:DNA-binding MarR family transcriptional regulator